MQNVMRDHRGFTLIELLIVVVIIGILAAIAIPKFSETREKAYFSSMKSDLKNLATQQEIYYADGYQYTDQFGNLGFTTSEGVGVDITLPTDPSSGWSAEATHEALDDSQDGCAIYYGLDAHGGDGTPIAPDEAGQIACTDSN